MLKPSPPLGIVRRPTQTGTFTLGPITTHKCGSLAEMRAGECTQEVVSQRNCTTCQNVFQANGYLHAFTTVLTIGLFPSRCIHVHQIAIQHAVIQLKHFLSQYYSLLGILPESRGQYRHSTHSTKANFNVIG